MTAPRILSFVFLLIALGWSFNQFRKTGISAKLTNLSAPPSIETKALVLPLPRLSEAVPKVFSKTPTPIENANQQELNQSKPVGKNITIMDVYGRESAIDTPHVSSAQSTLKERTAIDPEKDFDSLVMPDFNDQHTGMFSGIFEDRKTHIQLQISYDTATSTLSETACVVTKESGQVPQRDNSILLKDNRAGYAGMMIKNRWYLKLAYTFNPQRTLIGKLYERGEDGWSYLYDFAAQETYDLKLKCTP